MVQVHEASQRGDTRWRQHENEALSKSKGICRGEQIIRRRWWKLWDLFFTLTYVWYDICKFYRI